MKTATGLIFLLLLLTVRSYAQELTVSVANNLQYGTGEERTFLGKETKEYFENLTDARLFLGDFTAGFRLEYSKPPEFGIPFQGISKKYLEFEKSGFNFRAGDLYALYSRGMALNLFENRVIGYDTGLEGARLQYENDFLNINVLGGKINYVEPLTFDRAEPRRESYTVYSGFAEIRPWRRISVGSSLVWTETEMPTPFPDRFDNVKSHTVDSFIRFRYSSGDLYFGYAFRAGNVNDTHDIGGSGMYVSLSQTVSRFGVTLEYKDYRFDVVDPFERVIAFRPSRMHPFQNPPIAHKRHSHSLMSRFPRVVDFNDEVGFQVDIVGTLTPTLYANINFSMASRHYSYRLNEQFFEAEKIQSGVSWLPSASDTRSPYRELYFDLDYFFANFSSFVKIGYNIRNELFYELLAPDISEDRRLNTLLFEIQYAFTLIWSAKLTSEFQRVYDSINIENNRYYNQLIGVQVSRAPLFSFGFRYDYTTNSGEPGGMNDWFVLDAGVRIGSTSNLSVSYGTERGGIVCINGICRTVKTYEGVRLILTTVI
jgi:hypothetical protein